MSLIATNKIHYVPASGHIYAYLHYPPSDPLKPTLLFLHGFPSTSYDWRHQTSYFKSKGYGVLAPDLLGNGGSSKPLNVEDYMGTVMAKDIVSILDGEGNIGEIVGIAHDWGTYLLSQLAIYYPNKFGKFVFFSGPFNPPGQANDIPRFNAITKKILGYEQTGYWYAFTEKGFGKVIRDHWESFFNLCYPADSSIWATQFAPTGALKKFLLADSTCTQAPWVTEEDKVHHHAAFGDDYTPSLFWYHRGINSLGVKEEKELLKLGVMKNKLGKETLMVTGLRDAVSSAKRSRLAMEKSVEKGLLKVVDVDAGHWIMLERAKETNQILEDFFENGVGGQGTKALL